MIRVLPKDYQLDPVKDFLIHVDFLRVSSRTVVHVNIAVHFENDDADPGLKVDGGTLNVAHHSVAVECPAESIPEAFTIDLTGLAIGDAIHASALTLPRGVTLTDESDFVIATIVPPMAEEVDELDEATPETEVTEQGAEPAADAEGDEK